MKTCRFGFIGAGKIATFSASALLQHKRGNLVAVQDLSRPRREALATEFDIPQAFETAAELFRCEEVDAVYIAVPNKLHAELAIEAMEAGKHVILEKPFALSVEEAEAVVAAAERTKRVFTLGMNQRFMPDSQRIRTLTENGALGDIYYAKAYWMRRSGIPTLGTWFGNKALAGAGAINDIGVHMLDLCLHLMNNFDPVSVTGVSYTKFGQRGLGEGDWGISDKTEGVFDVDDLSAAIIRMRNGATVNLEASWACHQAEPYRMNVELFGTEAGASAYPACVYKRDADTRQYSIVQNPNASLAYPHCDRFHNFINHILEGEKLLVSPQEALTVQRILDAVAQSSVTGESVAI